MTGIVVKRFAVLVQPSALQGIREAYGRILEAHQSDLRERLEDAGSGP